ncbi:MAG: hypothetical protein Q8O53_01085 [Candidatus Moranbacteria bacterium]|nr:hypothetical protein [Candidatus Moranbacteria bacterium]
MEKGEIQKRWGKFKWVFLVIIFSPIIVSALFFLLFPSFISDTSENTLFYITSTIGFMAIAVYLWLFIYSIRLAIFLSGKKVTGVYVFLLTIIFFPLVWFYIRSLKNKALEISA